MRGSLCNKIPLLTLVFQEYKRISSNQHSTMASGIFIFDIIATLALSGLLLFSYGDWFRQRIFVTISVLLAWYFSFLIIFVLPLDISSTTYRQCLANVNKTGLSSTSTNTIIHEQDVQHITENEIIKHKVRNSNASSVSKVLQDNLHLQVRKIGFGILLPKLF